MRIHLAILTVGFVTISGLLAQAEPGYAKAIKATPILRTTTTSAGQPIVYPKTENPEVTALLVEIPPGAETGWHRHPFPCYGYILSGSLTVEIEGGKTGSYKAGDALAETVNLLHNGKNTGTEPVKLVMFVTGEKGQPFTVKAAK
jgi:quercetin dioxygenase-like cupin family protein